MNRIAQSTSSGALRSLSRRTCRSSPHNGGARRWIDTVPGPEAPSKRTPMVIGSLALIGVATYIALGPQKQAQDAKAQEKLSEGAKEAQAQAAQRERERDHERAPKPNPNADSNKRHAGHAETNEQKVRKGKFSDVEFDNHDTSHSTDPGKDFEVRKKANK